MVRRRRRSHCIRGSKKSKMIDIVAKVLDEYDRVRPKEYDKKFIRERDKLICKLLEIVV